MNQDMELTGQRNETCITLQPSPTCASICGHKSFSGDAMETFSIRDLRDRTGDLVRGAEAGELALVAKHGHPVFLALPFDETLVREGVLAALALKLFDTDVVSLGKAARIARLSQEAFITLCGT